MCSILHLGTSLPAAWHLGCLNQRKVSSFKQKWLAVQSDIRERAWVLAGQVHFYRSIKEAADKMMTFNLTLFERPQQISLGCFALNQALTRLS